MPSSQALTSFKEALDQGCFTEMVGKQAPPADIVYKYGTAGFRMKADLLPCAVFRTGLLAALRSASLGGARVGVVITASHNPVQDNGIKIVDASGAMLGELWESRAANLANLPADEVGPFLKGIAEECEAEEGSVRDWSQKPSVVVARDTRPSGPGLVAVFNAGVSLCNGTVVDEGELTTPQLHWLVAALNNEDALRASGLAPTMTCATELGYYSSVSDAFAVLIAGSKMDTVPEIVIDAANGVGGPAARKLSAVMGDTLCKITVRNDGSADGDVLNEGCGSDYVKTGQKAPRGVDLTPGSAVLNASFDGDADRVVCYRSDADGKFCLLDGDKILTLFAIFVKKCLKDAGIEEYVKVLAVQTAYANGASTDYLKGDLALETDFTQTGVKNLHHRALECDGVSIYFEANGHGTAVFGPGFYKALKIARPADDDDAGHLALRRLRAFATLINPHVGDAITDALGVLGVLTALSMTPAGWDASYADVPNALGKCAVRDRSAVTTARADTVCVTPEGLQAEIDQAVAQCDRGRCFVRASGTEDVVRVYAEAATKEGADALVEAVKGLVVRYCS